MNIFRSKISQHSIISLGTTIINGILGFLFYLYLARVFGAAEFGNFLLVVAVIIVGSDLADFGINSGVINFVSKHRGEVRSYSFLFSALVSKVLIGVIVSILVFLLSSLVAVQLFQKEELVGLFMIGAGGILGLMLFSFSTSALQSMERYGSWAVILIGSNLLRFIAIFGLMYFNFYSIESVLISYIVVPYIFFFLSFFFLPVKKIIKAENMGETIKALVSFSAWVGGSNVVWVVLSKADTFLLGRLVTSFQLGIYGLASQLTVAVPQLISAFAAVLGPRFAAFSNQTEMNRFLQKFSFIVTGISIIGILCLPVVRICLPYLLGEEYIQSFPIFVILVIGSFLLLIATPMHEAIRYYFQRPQLFLIIYSIQLLLLVSFGIHLSNYYGILGMGYAVLVANFTNLILSFYFYWRLLKK